MPQYRQLDTFLLSVRNGSDPAEWADVIAYLTHAWLGEYARSSASTDIVVTAAANSWYLFDSAQQRLIAAYGISRDQRARARGAARIAGYPKISLYHRGRAIRHTFVRDTDIDAVPQLASVNIVPFRQLEKEAIATPGSFYFTYWTYAGPDTQQPTAVDTGLLVPGGKAKVQPHVN